MIIANKAKQLRRDALEKTNSVLVDLANIEQQIIVKANQGINELCYKMQAPIFIEGTAHILRNAGFEVSEQHDPQGTYPHKDMLVIRW